MSRIGVTELPQLPKKLRITIPSEVYSRVNVWSAGRNMAPDDGLVFLLLESLERGSPTELQMQTLLTQVRAEQS